MQKPSALLIVACLFGFLGSLGFGQLPQPGARGGLGLQIALTTTAYRFDVTGDPTPDRAGRLRPQSFIRRESFTASAALLNLSRSDVTLAYPTAAAAADRFAFRILSSSGAELWTSAPVPGAGDSVPLILPKHSALRRTAAIPLKIGGAWLPSGKYTLETKAGLEGPSASIPFEVVSPAVTPLPPEPPPGTGLSGHLSDLDTAGPPVPVSATIRIQELGLRLQGDTRPFFSWTGQTDALGFYQAHTPAGSFTVSMTRNDGSGQVIPEPNSGYAPIVIVTAGAFTTYDHTFYSSRASTLPLIDSISLISVDAQVMQTNSIPPSIYHAYVTTAVGPSSTGGSNPRLVPRASSDPDVLEYDFLLDPPAPGSAATAPLQYSATDGVSGSRAVKLIRVHGRANSKEFRTMDGQQIR